MAQNSLKQTQQSTNIIDLNNLIPENNINNNTDVTKNVENNPVDSIETVAQIQNSPEKLETTKCTDAIIIQNDGFFTSNNSHLLDAVQSTLKFYLLDVL